MQFSWSFSSLEGDFLVLIFHVEVDRHRCFLDKTGKVGTVYTLAQVRRAQGCMVAFLQQILGVKVNHSDLYLDGIEVVMLCFYSVHCVGVEEYRDFGCGAPDHRDQFKPVAHGDRVKILSEFQIFAD